MAFGISNEYLSGLDMPEKEIPGQEVTKKPIAQEEQKVVKPVVQEPAQVKTPEATQPEVKTPETPIESPELTEEQILAHLNKGREEGQRYKSLADLSQVKEVEKVVEKVVNPYEGLITDEDKAYFKFKKENKGSTRKDFEVLNRDFSTVSPLELAIEKIRKDTELSLSDIEAKEYLEQSLNVDLSNGELSSMDKISLSSFSKPYVDALKAEKEKYFKQEEQVAPKQESAQPEIMELEDGTKVYKKEYEEYQAKKSEYINNVQEAVNRVSTSDISIEIKDDNGEKRKLDFSYEYSEQDKHSMLSEAENIDATIKNRYGGDEKNFNYQGLALDLWRGKEENFNMVIKRAMEVTRAETILEMNGQKNNTNFSRPKLDTIPKENKGYGEVGQTTGKAGKFGLII